MYKYKTFGIISHKVEHFHSIIGQWAALKKCIFNIKIAWVQNDPK